MFADYTAKQLSSVASDLKIAGRSKMDKAALFDAVNVVIDAAHAEALKVDTEQDVASTVEEHVRECQQHTSHSQEVSETFYAPAEEWERDLFLAAAQGNHKRLPRKTKKALKKSFR